MLQQRTQLLKLPNSLEPQGSPVDIYNSWTALHRTAVQELEVRCKVAQLNIVLFSAQISTNNLKIYVLPKDLLCASYWMSCWV